MPGEFNPIPRVSGTNVSLSNSVLSAILSKSTLLSIPPKVLGSKPFSVATGTGMKPVGESSSVPTSTEGVMAARSTSARTLQEKENSKTDGSVTTGDGRVAVGNGKVAMGDTTGGSEGGPVEIVAAKAPKSSDGTSVTAGTVATSSGKTNAAETITAKRSLVKVKVHCRCVHSLFHK